MDAHGFSRKDNTMGPLDHLDVSAEELGELVDGEVWRRWVDAEPLLDALASLSDLRGHCCVQRSGRARDWCDDIFVGLRVCWFQVPR